MNGNIQFSLSKLFYRCLRYAVILSALLEVGCATLPDYPDATKIESAEYSQIIIKTSESLTGPVISGNLYSPTLNEFSPSPDEIIEQDMGHEFGYWHMVQLQYCLIINSA